MIVISYDELDGLVRTVTQGTTSRDEIEAYILQLFEIIERIRARNGRYLHLVDASRLDMQSEENLNILAGVGVEMQQEEDRTAVVMTSSAAIAQLDHMPSQFRTMVFPELGMAREWLYAQAKGDVEMLDP